MVHNNPGPIAHSEPVSPNKCGWQLSLHPYEFINENFFSKPGFSIRNRGQAQDITLWPKANKVVVCTATNEWQCALIGIKLGEMCGCVSAEKTLAFCTKIPSDFRLKMDCLLWLQKPTLIKT